MPTSAKVSEFIPPDITISVSCDEATVDGLEILEIEGGPTRGKIRMTVDELGALNGIAATLVAKVRIAST